MAGINQDTEIHCPNCNRLFCRMTPAGHAAGHFWCDNDHGCGLDFVIEHPLPPLIFLRSASALLTEKGGYDLQKAQSILADMTECVTRDGHPLLLWCKVQALLPARRNKIFLSTRTASSAAVSLSRHWKG